MKISFITTVFNEEKTIERFLRSLATQTKQPDEIVIVDGGSTDATVERIKEQELRFKDKNITFNVYIKTGNRSVGRNEAIKKASGDIIVCSDSGNVLDKNWLENITRPFFSQKSSSRKSSSLVAPVDVVAGYYKGLARNVFQKCLVPYVLVMPDKVDPEKFFPATRSIAFKKKIWKKVGGFNEKYSHNEDYVFANKLKDAGAKIVFAKDAIVNWIPRNTYKEAFVMFFRFALGDAEAGIWRTNVLLLLARYFLGFYFVFLSILYKSFVPLLIILISLILYVIWSIRKNYKYVKQEEAYKVLPALQFAADVAVLFGTILGSYVRILQFNYKKYILSNKFFFFILFIYLGIEIMLLQTGSPNKNHPFPYNMDEWHQLQAVRATFKYGTPNMAGAANGTMLQFILSGLYLIPFTLLQIVNPAVLKINDLAMRETIFILLRLNTLLWGVLSLFLIYKIAKLIKISGKLALTLFAITPIWLYLTGYFKYDIALSFWILLSLFFLIRFIVNPTNKNYILAAIPASLAIAVKVSAIPLVLIYFLSYFFYMPNRRASSNYLFLGMVIFSGCLLLFGMPDSIFGKGNLLHYFYENVVTGPINSSNFQLGGALNYLFFHNFPIIFGHGLFLFFISACIFWIYLFIHVKFNQKNIQFKIVLFLFFSLLIFVLSLLPLRMFATGYRAVVLLPFFVLLACLAFEQIKNLPRFVHFSKIFLILIIVVQLYESFAWVYIRAAQSPQQAASIWIEKNIQKKQLIGLENIPIYQGIPDILQKEFYFFQYKVGQTNKYRYLIIDEKTSILPPTVVITNAEPDMIVFRQTPKRNILKRLAKEGYKKVAVFYPDFRFYKLFGSEIDYYQSYITATPLTIEIYRK